MTKLIPEEIQIGPYKLNVVLESPVFADNDRCLGKHDPINFTITLDSSALEQQQSETFMHEILEAIVSVYSLELSHDLLSIISVGLTQALQPIWKEKSD